MRRLLISIILGCVTLAGCRPTLPTPTTQDNRPLVVASFYPLGYFAQAVGGDLIRVETVIPTGVEPHEFEPTPQQQIRIRQAALFVYLGVGFDPWAQRIANDSDQPVTSLVASTGLQLLLDKTEGADHVAGGRDPHVWLDPVLVQTMVEHIRDQLITIDPVHTADYQANTRSFIDELYALDQSYRTGLANCRVTTFITSHAAFGYLAYRYQLTMVPLAGLSPENEPSPRALAAAANLAKQHKLSVVFFESLVSPKIAQTVAEEAGLQSLPLNPIEGLTPDEQRVGKDYLGLMKDNLTNLRLALQCQ